MSRFALITGASGNIGRVLSGHFAQRGVRLLLADRREDVHELAKQLAAGGAEVEGHVVNLADEQSVLELAARARTQWDGCDILINNAGIGGGEMTEKLTTKAWELSLKINLTAPFLLSRELAPAMAAKGWGRVINVASRLGRTYVFNASLSYSTTKAGLIGMSRQLGGEFAGRGVTVNAIAPGSIDTGYLETLSADDAARLRDNIPAGRPGKTEEVAALAYFLASDEAAFITGACVDINGGAWMG
jgi:3-oxoacyl-[acyl-carrier protein] reductase